MKSKPQMQAVINTIQFEHHPDLVIRFGEDGVSTYVMQLVDLNMDPSFNTGRKWRISPHMTTSEIVGTAWKAYMTWLEHEARESFLYRGRAVYGPHLDVEALWEAAGDRDNYEYRS